MNNIWKWIGGALLGWVAWDLYWGYTLLWDLIYREDNPTLYWSVVTAWFVLAVSCFFSGKDSLKKHT